MFGRINLHFELQKERERIKPAEDRLLNEAKKVLVQEVCRDKNIQERMMQIVPVEETLKLKGLKHENIFFPEEIRNICSGYRLRFLETKYLRYPLPYEAFIRIKEFEKQQQAEIKQFSIMAPAEAFRLDKKMDPMLFAHIGDNRYYFLYKWGNDLSWSRKMLMLPLRNLCTLSVTIVLISFAVAFLLPKEWIVYDENLYPLMYNFRLFLFFLISTGSFATIFYIGITRNKNFSEDAWNSKWI